MSKRAFDKIAEGLTEALSIARGESQPAKLHVPAELNVRDIRRALGMSQDDFAAVFGFSVHQIRDWEQGRSRPLGGVRAYLLLIKTHPDDMRRLLAAASKDAADDDVAA